jgi:hypothetical protein
MPPVVRMLLFHASEPTLESCTPFRVLNCTKKEECKSSSPGDKKTVYSFRCWTDSV